MSATAATAAPAGPEALSKARSLAGCAFGEYVVMPRHAQP